MLVRGTGRCGSSNNQIVKGKFTMGILTPILATLGTVGIHLLTSLVTEAFLKKALLISLEKLVKRTESDVDDKLLEAAKEAWK